MRKFFFNRLQKLTFSEFLNLFIFTQKINSIELFNNLMFLILAIFNVLLDSGNMSFLLLYFAVENGRFFEVLFVFR